MLSRIHIRCMLIILVTNYVTGQQSEWLASDDDVDEFWISSERFNMDDSAFECGDLNAYLAMPFVTTQFNYVAVQLFNIRQNILYYVNVTYNFDRGVYLWGNEMSIPNDYWGNSVAPAQPTARNENYCAALRFNTVNRQFSLTPVNCATLSNYICQRQKGSNWSNWSAWSACPQSCINGTRTRSRTCNQLNEIGNEYCAGTESDIGVGICPRNVCTFTCFVFSRRCPSACGDCTPLTTTEAITTEALTTEALTTQTSTMFVTDITNTTFQGDQSNFNGTSITSIVAGVVSGIIVLLIIGIVICCLVRRKNNENNTNEAIYANDTTYETVGISTVNQQVGINDDATYSAIGPMGQHNGTLQEDNHYEVPMSGMNPNLHQSNGLSNPYAVANGTHLNNLPSAQDDNVYANKMSSGVATTSLSNVRPNKTLKNDNYEEIKLQHESQTDYDMLNFTASQPTYNNHSQQRDNTEYDSLQNKG